MFELKEIAQLPLEQLSKVQGLIIDVVTNSDQNKVLEIAECVLRFQESSPEINKFLALSKCSWTEEDLSITREGIANMKRAINLSQHGVSAFEQYAAAGETDINFQTGNLTDVNDLTPNGVSAASKSYYLFNPWLTRMISIGTALALAAVVAALGWAAYNNRDRLGDLYNKVSSFISGKLARSSNSDRGCSIVDKDEVVEFLAIAKTLKISESALINLIRFIRESNIEAVENFLCTEREVNDIRKSQNGFNGTIRAIR